MRIHSLKIENFKRIELVDLKLDGGVVEITGRNGQGKSSVLDAIWSALAGKRATPDMPIRVGAAKSTVRIELDDMVVERGYSQGGQTLKVTSKDGTRLGSPQEVLDSLWGRLAFDPLEFARSKPKEQATMLQRALGIDTTAIDAKIAELEQDRLLKGRELAKYGDVTDRPLVEPDEPVNLDGLHAEFKKLLELRLEANAEASQRKANAQRLQGVVDTIRQKQEEIAELERQAKEIRALLDTPPTEIDGLDERIAKVEADIAGAKEHNQKSEQDRKIRERQDQAGLLETEYEELDESVKQVRAQRMQLIEQAKLPVSGLTFDSDGVAVNNIPFSQVSTREQIVLSTHIGMAMNPKLRLMFIREGSLIDTQGLRELHKLAADHDYQIIVERVTDGQPVGVVIEDGRVKASDAE